MKKVPFIPSANYGVGYGKPPGDSRFKPGQSGNPKGRPKGSKNKPETSAVRFMEDFQKEGARPISYFDNGKKVKTTAVSAVMRRVFAEALRGDVGAARIILMSQMEVDRHKLREREKLLDVVTKHIHDCSDMPEAVRAQQLPNPNHLVFDGDRVQCFGPFSPRQKLLYDQMKAESAELNARIDATMAAMKKGKISERRRKDFLEDCLRSDKLEHELRPDKDWLS